MSRGDPAVELRPEKREASADPSPDGLATCLRIAGRPCHVSNSLQWRQYCTVKLIPW